jgi:hypothetical protein
LLAARRGPATGMIAWLGGDAARTLRRAMDGASKPPPANQPRESDGAIRYVFCQRPRCLDCDSADLETYKSTAGGDGSVMRHTRCRACKAHFRVVWE